MLLNRIEASESASWASPRAGEFSAWHGHVAFAHWLVDVLRPKRIVELGTHNGASYFSFCNAVRNTAIDCKCTAVDTWEGDEHSGLYTQKIFEGVRSFNDRNFASFSQLLRMKFDEALSRIPDKSVDLLHIDGLHEYDAVKHDFDNWLPKVGKNGVILFHDISERGQGFGVWRLWEEVSAQYPNFAFQHSSGLGMLVIGKDVEGDLKSLCDLSRSLEGEAIRQAFESLSASAELKGLQNLPKHEGRPFHSIVGRNIAVGARTTQSSSVDVPKLKKGGAVSGERTGGWGFHTNFEYKPWWQIDLGREEPIQSVVIFNTLDERYSARSRNIEILGSSDGKKWKSLYFHDGTVFGGVTGEPLVVDLHNRRIRFLRIRQTDVGVLHLDEVEVYAGTQKSMPKWVAALRGALHRSLS